jgi:hypothetical protein
MTPVKLLVGQAIQAVGLAVAVAVGRERVAAAVQAGGQLGEVAEAVGVGVGAQRVGAEARLVHGHVVVGVGQEVAVGVQHLQRPQPRRAEARPAVGAREQQAAWSQASPASKVRPCRLPSDPSAPKSSSGWPTASASPVPSSSRPAAVSCSSCSRL